MAISRVSAQDATGTGAAGTVSATYPGATTANNLLIAIVTMDNSSGSTTGPAGFTQASNPSTSSAQGYIYYKIAAGSETTITVSDTASSNMRLAIFEYTGNKTSGVLDKTASGGDGITSVLSVSTGTTATTTQADELAIGFGAWENGGHSFSSATNSFSSIASVSGDLFVIQKILSATGTVESTVTVSGTSSTAVGGVATFNAAPTPALTSTLNDNFDDNSTDTTKWPNSFTSGATYSEASNQVTFTLVTGDNYAAYVSDNLDLTNSYIHVEVKTMCNTGTNAQAYMTFSDDASNQLLWIQEAGTLYAQKTVAGSTTTVFSDTYDNTTYRWWRIRTSSGTTYWETSNNGISWTTRYSEATPITVTSGQVNIGGGCYQAETSPGTIVMDNFNVYPSITAWFKA